MKDAKFTNGNWYIDPERKKHYVYISGGRWLKFARVVVRTEESDEDNQEGIANARLIATAPEMYNTLIICAELLIELQPELCAHSLLKARKAIGFASDVINKATYGHE